jgi:hypothetical protein
MKRLTAGAFHARAWTLDEPGASNGENLVVVCRCHASTTVALLQDFAAAAFSDAGSAGQGTGAIVRVSEERAATRLVAEGEAVTVDQG